MLEIRRITAGEATDSKKIGVVAFNGRRDFAQAADPDPYEDPHEWTWGAFENGKMVSKMTELPYVMRFDGNDVKMSGIGGVATLPEARKGGKVRMIFDSLLAGAYADGVIFSCLVPFSHQFYRRFGYEVCTTRREMRVPTHELSRIKPPDGAHEQIFPGGDTAGIKKVHEAYIEDKNHAIRRDAAPFPAATGSFAYAAEGSDWNYFIRQDPYNTGAFLYLWRDAAGEPRGYISYQHKRGTDGNEIGVREIMFLDAGALHAQLAFAGGLSAAVKDFVWAMPSFIDPSDFVEVAWEVKQRLMPQDMTRVVNVKAALERMRRPDGEGEYVIETDDHIIPQNNGRWLVEYGPEGSRVSATNRDADLYCELPALAQLITGYRTLANLMLTSPQRVEARANIPTLNKVFTLRPQHMTENF